MHLLEPMFVEDHPDGFEEVALVTEDSPLRFSWDGLRKALDDAEPDPEGVEGTRIRLDAPDMPTMALDVHRFEAGEETRPVRSHDQRDLLRHAGARHHHRSTASRSPGSAATPSRGRCGGASRTAIEEDAVVFRMSDEPLMKFAKFYRRELD